MKSLFSLLYKNFYKIRLFTSLLFLSLLTLNCGSNDFKKYSQLEGLRVLAIVADKPQINPNQENAITLQPYISFVDGGETTLKIQYEACPDPGVGGGAKISCKNANEELSVKGEYTFATEDFEDQRFYTGFLPEQTIVLPLALTGVFNLLESSVQFNGFNYLVTFHISDESSDQSITSYKIISLSSKEPEALAQNPSISGGIEVDGAEATGFPEGNVRLSVNGIAPPRQYEILTPSGMKIINEGQFITWFSSSGELEFTRTDADASVKFSSKKNEGVIVAVVRDGRGGMTVLRTP
jgi:hypothetical protein